MKTKIKKYTKKRILLTLVAALVVFMMSYTNVFAASDLSNTLNIAMFTILDVFVTILSVLQRLLWPILLLIGGLMNNDILFGPGMEERLLTVWVQVRNIVNILFALLLVGLAIYNVVNVGAGENYDIKKLLPRFAIALILVNFSFIGLKVFLDATNVIATGIFAIPEAVGTTLETRQSLFQKQNEICKQMYDESVLTGKDKNGKPRIEGTYCAKAETGNTYEFNTKGKEYFNRFNGRNVAIILAVEMMSILDVTKVSGAFTQYEDIKSQITKDGDKVTKVPASVKEVFFNILFSTVLYVIYGTAFVALFVVLLVRLVVLWIIIALSPLAGIAIALPGMKSLGGDMNLQEQFIQNAIAPILIGIPISIGFIMLTAFKGAGVGSVPALGEGQKLDVFSISASGVEDLQMMIMAFGICAVVWLGVFAAAEKTAARSAVGVIKSTVTSVGKQVAALPYYAPIFPTAEGRKWSPFELKRRMQDVAGMPEAQARQRYNKEFGNQYTSFGDVKTKEQFFRTLGGKTDPTGRIQKGEGKVAVKSMEKNFHRDKLEKIAQDLMGPSGTWKQLSAMLASDQINKAYLGKLKTLAKRGGSTGTPVPKAVQEEEQLVQSNMGVEKGNIKKYFGEGTQRTSNLKIYKKAGKLSVKDKTKEKEISDVLKKRDSSLSGIKIGNNKLTKDQRWAIYEKELAKQGVTSDVIKKVKTEYER